MAREPAQPFTHEGRRFIPVHVDSIDCCTLPIDLYLRHGSDGAPTLYRSAGIDFTPEDIKRLASNEVSVVYIVGGQHVVYRQMLGDRLTRLLVEPGADKRAAATKIRSLCAGAIEDVLGAPNQPEAVQSVAEVSRHLAQAAENDAESFTFLLDMSSHDFYTATHMVNVGVGCGLLFRTLRPADRATLPKIIQGGLLHDIGKRGVPETILNKVGKLTAHEWQIVRRHPRLAFEELREHPEIPEVVLQMARDHHERLDGQGYPNELPRDQIGFAARVCAVVDVYDALTSNRKYRKALAPMEALAVMAEGVGTHFDPCILGAWCELMQGTAAHDHSRATESIEKTTRIRLDTFLPHCELSGAAAVPTAPPDRSRDRRRHPRFRYNAIVSASFLTQGRPCAVALHEPFPVLALDIGNGGVRIRTPWPLCLDDVLELRMNRGDGSALTQAARVVRVQSGIAGEYLAGLQYIDAHELHTRLNAA